MDNLAEHLIDHFHMINKRYPRRKDGLFYATVVKDTHPDIYDLWIKGKSKTLIEDGFPEINKKEDRTYTVDEVKYMMRLKIGDNYLMYCERKVYKNIQVCHPVQLTDSFFVYFVKVMKFRSSRAINLLNKQFRQYPIDFADDNKLDDWETDDEEMEKIYQFFLENGDYYLDMLFIETD